MVFFNPCNNLVRTKCCLCPQEVAVELGEIGLYLKKHNTGIKQRNKNIFFKRDLKSKGEREGGGLLFGGTPGFVGELVLSSEPRRIRGVLPVLRGSREKEERKQRSEGRNPRGPVRGRVAETEGRKVSVGSKAKLRVRT